MQTLPNRMITANNCKNFSSGLSIIIKKLTILSSFKYLRFMIFNMTIIGFENH